MVSAFSWSLFEGGFSFREDDYSWQGALAEDKFFFLRRDKIDPTAITDCNFGHATRETSIAVFSKFLEMSGGLKNRKICFLKISEMGMSHAETVSKHDSVTQVGRDAIVRLGMKVDDVRLEQEGNRWNSVIYYSS